MNDVFEIFSRNKTDADFQVSTHISLKNKYAFIQVSKSASSSVKWSLQTLELKSTNWKVINVNNKLCSPHISPFQLENSALNELFFSKNFKKVSFVRNPFSRLLSCYLHRIVARPNSASNRFLMKLTGGRGGEDVSFDEFIEIICSQKSKDQEAHWRCQADELCIDKIDYDFIGKVESIEADLPVLLKMLYGDKTQLTSEITDASPMKTGTSQKLFKFYNDKATVSRVVERYKADFDSFNYSSTLGE